MIDSSTKMECLSYIPKEFSGVKHRKVELGKLIKTLKAMDGPFTTYDLHFLNLDQGFLCFYLGRLYKLKYVKIVYQIRKINMKLNVYEWNKERS